MSEPQDTNLHDENGQPRIIKGGNENRGRVINYGENKAQPTGQRPSPPPPPPPPPSAKK